MRYDVFLQHAPHGVYTRYLGRFQTSEEAQAMLTRWQSVANPGYIHEVPPLAPAGWGVLGWNDCNTRIRFQAREEAEEYVAQTQWCIAVAERGNPPRIEWLEADYGSLPLTDICPPEGSPMALHFEEMARSGQEAWQADRDR